MIENIKISGDSEVSIYPKRGGIVTSLKLNSKEVLYLDEETLKNKDVSVRGGVPILFPNAGPVDSPQFPNLKQHGFARNSDKWILEKNQNGFKETLNSNEENSISYPYNFSLTIEGKFEKNNSFTIIQSVKNLEQEKVIPVSFGLHPYFRVSNKEKANIKFDFEGGKIIEDQINLWSNGQAISIDNPKIKDPFAIMEIIIPGLGNLILDVSMAYKKIWVWSLPDKDFICIEPFMRDAGGLIDDPENIKPKDSFSASFNLKLL